MNAVYTNLQYIYHYEKETDEIVQRARRITYIKFTLARCF